MFENFKFCAILISIVIMIIGSFFASINFALNHDEIPDVRYQEIYGLLESDREYYQQYINEALEDDFISTNEYFDIMNLKAQKSKHDIKKLMKIKTEFDIKL